MVDAAVKSGISRQVDAFKSGFDQVINYSRFFVDNQFCSVETYNRV